MVVAAPFAFYEAYVNHPFLAAKLCSCVTVVGQYFGCPDGQIIQLQARLFRALQSKVSELLPSGQAQVEAAAQTIANCIATRRKVAYVSVEGHSDIYQVRLPLGQTKDAVEEEKSQKRAAEMISFLQHRVADILQDQGLDRLPAKSSFPWLEQSKGAREFANTARRSEADMAQNRRAVIEVSLARISPTGILSAEDGARHSRRR